MLLSRFEAETNNHPEKDESGMVVLGSQFACVQQLAFCGVDSTKAAELGDARCGRHILYDHNPFTHGE